MRKFIIAAHAYFADGLKSGLEMIAGENADVFSVCAYVDDGDFTDKIDTIIESFDKDDEILILTDLFGGSVNNEILGKYDNKNIHLIAGVNLLLAIQLVLGEQENTTEEFITESIEQAKGGMVYCNKLKESFDVK
ncbi:MAG: PTS system fructose subfamily transporter subunit IIA [Bacillota bacterium]|nr:PTS system fructose subfamily transporter subunit IIA [Bacillota bacterium]